MSIPICAKRSVIIDDILSKPQFVTIHLVIIHIQNKYLDIELVILHNSDLCCDMLFLLQ